MKADFYQVPTLALMLVLVAVFASLCVRRRGRTSYGARSEVAPSLRNRHLLWLAGWIFALIRVALEVSGHDQRGPLQAISLITMELSPLMFMGSLAAQYFSRGLRIPFVAAFGAPIVVFAAIYAMVPAPGPWLQGILFLCIAADIYIGMRWGMEKNLLPPWLSLLMVGTFGGGCLWLVAHGESWMVLRLVHSGVLLMAALLFISAFRRLTPGLVFTAGGLLLWSVPSILALATGHLSVDSLRIVNLLRVITAVGMIVLVLEEEIAFNKSSQLRDRRARMEMEKYTAIYLTDTPLDEQRGHYNFVCEAVAGVSRFRQAAVFLRDVDGTFRLAGRAGMDGALEGALEALARRTSEEDTLRVAGGNYFSPVAGHLTLMDLTPLMQPGDELLQLGFRKAWVMGIRTGDGRLQGALLLAGLSDPESPILTEDVLPLEMLVARIGASREHLALIRRLMQTERMAGLGQLAGGVAHELNNPLTAVTGFAELLAENEGPGQKHALVILNEARRMKQIIESLMRFRHASPGGRMPVSVETLLLDIQKLARHDLDRARIRVRLRLPEHLPRVCADGEQLRQVFLQIFRNAMSSLEELPSGEERRLTIEASQVPSGLEITFSHNGLGFPEPDRAFDPYFTTRHPGEGVGLGLSICYAIVREHQGAISAVNLEPRGAAVVIELPLWDASSEDATMRESKPQSRGDFLLSGDQSSGAL
jgi:signal transduction histidine kinase